jgi:hypothetical protein
MLPCASSAVHLSRNDYIRIRPHPATEQTLRADLLDFSEFSDTPINAPACGGRRVATRARTSSRRTFFGGKGGISVRRMKSVHQKHSDRCPKRHFKPQPNDDLSSPASADKATILAAPTSTHRIDITRKLDSERKKGLESPQALR